MLSEEQAIEKLKKIKEDTMTANECGLSNNDFKEEIEVYDTVLTLITKLQKEDEEKDRYIKNSEEITTEMNNDIKKLLLENKNKDKKIDLIYDFLYKFGCERSGSFMKALGLNGFDLKKCDNCKFEICNCKDCIKQYFNRKVNE